MATVTFTISAANLTRVKAAMKELYPIPVDEDGDPEFTDNEWAKEAVRRLIRRDVARYEQKTGRDAVVYSEDDGIAS